MTDRGRLLWMVVGIVLGAGGALLVHYVQPEAQAANDRSGEYIICTGAVSINVRAPTEGVWVLDYRTGKLLATLIDRNQGVIASWAEVDLVSEFGLMPRQKVHFMMTTGMIAQGQAVLYVAETTSGKFAVYSMGTRPDGKPGLMVKRHDMRLFRSAPNS